MLQPNTPPNTLRAGSEYIRPLPGQSQQWPGLLDRSISTAFSSFVFGAVCSARSGWPRARLEPPGVPREFQSFRRSRWSSSSTRAGARHLPRHQQDDRAARADDLLLDPADELHGRGPGGPVPAWSRRRPGVEHLKVVPTTDLNITLGMSLTVFSDRHVLQLQDQRLRRLHLGAAHASSSASG